MSGYKVNPERVRAAYLHGLKPALIAQRLGITERHVRRICQDIIQPIEDPFAGTSLEFITWKGYQLNNGYSYRKLAEVFCLSHEHIRQTLNQKTHQAA